MDTALPISAFDDLDDDRVIPPILSLFDFDMDTSLPKSFFDDLDEDRVIPPILSLFDLDTDMPLPMLYCDDLDEDRVTPTRILLWEDHLDMNMPMPLPSSCLELLDKADPFKSKRDSMASVGFLFWSRSASSLSQVAFLPLFLWLTGDSIRFGQDEKHSMESAALSFSRPAISSLSHLALLRLLLSLIGDISRFGQVNEDVLETLDTLVLDRSPIRQDEEDDEENGGLFVFLTAALFFFSRDMSSLPQVALLLLFVSLVGDIVRFGQVIEDSLETLDRSPRQDAKDAEDNNLGLFVFNINDESFSCRVRRDQRSLRTSSFLTSSRVPKLEHAFIRDARDTLALSLTIDNRDRSPLRIPVRKSFINMEADDFL
jgi:hypothetical protein